MGSYEDIIIRIILVTVAAYLVGSIPTGVLVSRIVNADPLSAGSRKTGTTNVYRVAGPGAMIVVAIGDICKGVVAGLAARFLVPENALFWAIIGFAAIFGHVWSVFLKFRGGRGVATAAGLALTLFPVTSAIAVGIGLLLIIFTRIASIGSLSGAAIFVGAQAILVPSLSFDLLAVALFLFLFISHRDNIVRLIHGKELRMTRIQSSNSNR